MKAQLNILMFGAKRCGKSSILASMVSSLEKTDADITISYNNKDTRKTLGLKERQLRRVFSDENIKQGWWTDPEEDSTEGLEKFQFTVKWNENLIVDVLCVDIPGEWIEEQEEMIKKLMKEANVFIVAIDTPQLMENGMAGKIFNHTGLINDLIIDLAVENQDYNKRIIFVPVKSEKYIHTKNMREVNERIKEAYSDVIHHWRQQNSPVFITPVETLGNIEFDSFEKNRDTPTVARYKYIGNKSYAPRWCEQPMIYAIEHALINIPWDGSGKPTIFQKITKGTLDFISDNIY